MINEEDVKRYQEAKGCKDCLGWHKHCKAECCKIISLNIDPAELERTQSPYLIIKVRPMTPSDQRYYRLRDVRYSRGTLRFLKERIHVFGRKVVYLHHCEMLDKNNMWMKVNKMKTTHGHRFRKQELILRFFAFHDMYTNYNGRLSRFLNEYMSDNRNPSNSYLNNKRELFLKFL